MSCSPTDPEDLFNVTNPVSDGTLSPVSASGSYSYAPDPNFFGTDSFSYQLTDPDGDSNTATITITVDPVDDAPSFSAGGDDTVAEDSGTRTVNGWASGISAGPSNENGQNVSFVINSDNDSLFAAGPAVNGTTGDLTYTPAPNANGSATVTVHAQDSGTTANGGDNSSGSQSFTITVTPLNDPPTFTPGTDVTVSASAGPQSVGWATGISEGPANESGQTVSFTVTNDNHPLFSTQPAISSGGNLTYTPAASANGSATVSVQLIDSGPTGGGNDNSSGVVSFTIDVGGINDPPTFTKGSDQTVLEDAGAQTVSHWATAISPGPADEGSQTITFPIDSNSNAGLFAAGPTINGSSGNLTYTPAANANGTATIVLHALDSGGTSNGGDNSSGTQTFTITVTAVNDPPTFTAGGNQNVAENVGPRTVAGWATAISEGPANEVTSQTVSFTVTNNNNPLFSTQPAISPTGTLTYTLATSANGSATVSVQLFDNGPTGGTNDNSSAIATFTITVTGINDPPSFTTGVNQTDLEDAGAQSVNNWATAISPGPPDESGQSVTFVVTNNNNALFSAQPAISPGGTLTYTSAPNANGATTVTVFAQDNGGVANGGDNTSLSQTLTIAITPVNDPPSFVKGPDQTVLEDSDGHTVPAWATALSKGPLDEAAQTLTFVVVSNNKPALFSVLPSIGPTGDLTYSLAPNVDGTATIVIELHDNGTTANNGHDTSATQTFHINVTPQNDAPTCVNATAATFVGAALNSTLTTCADIDLDTLHYAVVAAPSHGTATVNLNGSFTYSPNVTYQGNDAFSFKANDGTVDSNVVTMSILVSPDPIAKNDVAPTDFPVIVQGSGPTAIPVLANDQDKQGGPLLITSVTQGSKGKVAITGGGTGLTYDPTGLATGTDSFRYTIIDDQSRTNSATVVVVISHAAPTSTRPMATMVTPGTLGTTTTKVRITWATTNGGTGLKSYRLQESYNGAPFKSVSLVTAKSTSSLRTFKFGKSYRYRLKVTDSAGNVSPWAISQTFVAGRSQETSVGIAYTGSWVLARSAGYSGGKARWANAAGASATFSFSGEGVAWVSSKGPTRGAAQVLIDGVVVKTVTLFASRMTVRQVVFRAAWPTMGLHTIQIVVVGTAGHPRVDVDTFVLAK